MVESPVSADVAIYSLMRMGTLQRSVLVPPERGYGEKGVLEIPPNATIQMEIELLSVK